jgi:hypothetical protein
MSDEKFLPAPEPAGYADLGSFEPRRTARKSTHGQIDSRKHPVGGAYYDEDR